MLSPKFHEDPLGIAMGVASWIGDFDQKGFQHRYCKELWDYVPDGAPSDIWKS